MTILWQSLDEQRLHWPQLLAQAGGLFALSDGAATGRGHAAEWISGIFSNFYSFKGSSRRLDCLGSYSNNSDLS
jgi:hypothetical protein